MAGTGTARDDLTVRLEVDGFPEDLRRELKAEAAHRGVTMRAALIDAVRNWVEPPAPEV
jgi:hypothetical protein